jgi:Glucose / Sorbosone dehydrogenase
VVTRAALAPLLAAALSLAGCGDGGGGPEPASPPSAAFVARAPDVAAMAPLPGGGLRFGERLTGAVRDADPRGAVRPGTVARVAVSTGGQRGLLGLAVDARDRTFAAWTRPDRRLVVAQVAPGRARVVWSGPPSATLANGGHLAFLPDGRLAIGIGDLQKPALTPDPTRPNGKLLSLDPDGGASQRPRILSTGWNNPFAFAVLPGGALWVADNAPGKVPERLARGDRGKPADVLDLPSGSTPSGLAPIAADAVAVCGVISGRLERYAVGPRPSGPEKPPLATDCRLGVARLADGRLAYSTGRAIRTVRP